MRGEVGRVRGEVGPLPLTLTLSPPHPSPSPTSPLTLPTSPSLSPHLTSHFLPTSPLTFSPPHPPHSLPTSPLHSLPTSPSLSPHLTPQSLPTSHSLSPTSPLTLSHLTPHSLPTSPLTLSPPHPSLSPHPTPALFCFCILSTTEYIWATSSSSSFPFFFLTFWGKAYRSPPCSMVLGSYENKKTFNSMYCTWLHVSAVQYMVCTCHSWSDRGNISYTTGDVSMSESGTVVLGVLW